LDVLGVEYYDADDFGGTACWMGQNYGNHIMHQDPLFSYTDAEWTAELGRLNLLGGDGVTDPIRAGDLVEIRVRGGLHYSGKMNVNETHNNDPAKDFEIVRLAAVFGLPEAAPLTLADLKTAADGFLFDPSRQTGGERYQSTRVDLREVWLTGAAAWTADSDITVTDGTRMFNVHLGLNPSFDGTALFAPGERFNVVGILDQAASNGVYSIDGYQLLAMNAADFAAASPFQPGDADGDGDVDLDDFVLLKQNFGRTGATVGEGDFDGDSDVDLDDFVILKQNFGAVPVPEPSALALLVLGGLGPRRRRR
jgi:MYXO-CTERM domain-containing protein